MTKYIMSKPILSAGWKINWC